MTKITELFILIIVLAAGKTFKVSKASLKTMNVNHDKSRVVGGMNAIPGSVVYQVSLRSNKKHFCCGTLLSKNWIVTSAVCIVGKTANDVSAVLGGSSSRGGTMEKVSQIISHNQFDPTLLHNNIALIQTTQEVQFNAYVQPIPLPTSNTEEGVPSALTGFASDSTRPNFLQVVDVYTVSNDECRHSLRNITQIDPSVLCASGGQGKGACNGDSGCPLAAGGRLIGIVSLGLSCGNGGPDVYTRIYAYRDWIKQNINIK